MQVRDGKLFLAVTGPVDPARYATKARRRGLPKTQKCAKCKNRATKRVLWAEGMAYQPACDDHLQQVSDELAAQNGGSVDGVRDIPAAETKDASPGTLPQTGPPQVTDTKPRDKLGKPVDEGVTVALGSGGQGTVLANEGGGRVRVRKDDGTEVVIAAAETTVIRGAAANAQRATGPDGLQAALAADPEATPPPGDRPDAQAETSTDVAVDRPVGAEPAPDADPAGAAAVLSTPTGDQLAWLRTDEGAGPVGYLRPDANDPTSTLRFTDTAAWANAVDAVGMEATNDVPVGPGAPVPGGQAGDPTLPPTTPPAKPEPVAASDLPAAAGAPTRVGAGPLTASPENLSLFLLDGLDQVPDAVAQAKAESIAGIVAGMADVPDDVVLRQEETDRLGRIESDQVVLLRIPKPGVQPSPAPTAGEQLTQWVYRELDQVRFQALLNSGTTPPPQLEMVTAEQWRAWSRAARIAEALSLWAAGSGGAHPDALALQEAAADLFGMDNYAPAPAFQEMPELRQQVDDALAVDRPFYEALLLAMYQATQDRFQQQGIAEVELYRGWRTPDAVPEWAAQPTTETLPTRPLSSWSADRQLAGGYARGNGFELGYITDTVFPVERIIGTPRTGFGSLQAEEFVVLAGPGPVAVAEATEADGPILPTVWAPPVDENDAGGHSATTGGDPTDPATVSAGLLGSEDDLTAAIAAADTDGRRLQLMHRAATMGLAGMIPEEWQADGSLRPVDLPDGAARDANGLLVPLDDTQFADHTAAVEDAIARAQAAGLESTKVHTLDGDGEVWAADRSAEHVAIVDAVWATAANVPDDGKALVVAGMPGASLSEALGSPQAGIDDTQYLTIGLDDIKEIMAARELVPDVPDAGVELSPMERVPLIHAEAVHVANMIAARAYAERKNIAWTLILGDDGTAETLIGQLRERGYGEVVGIFVDVPVQTSIDRSTDAYRAALEDYRNDEGLGGRYRPAATLREWTSTEFTSTPRVNFEHARDAFDDWQVWDDGTDGRLPELVYYKGAPNLDQLTEAARTGTAPQVKAAPGTRAALAALLRRERLVTAGGWRR